MRRKPPSQRLAEISYDGDLEAFVTAQRKAGKTWRTIAQEVSASIGHEVTYVSLFRWYSKKNGGEGAVA